MTTLREAAQQALEALGLWATGRDMDAVALNDLIFRLEAALAETVQAGCKTEADIIRMAREAGLFVPQAGIPENGALTRFAALVAAAEREACAQEFDRRDKGFGFYEPNEPAQIIRASGNT